MSAEVTTRRSLLLLEVDLGVERGGRVVVGPRVQGGQRSLPVSPGEPVVSPVVRDVTQTLAAHAGLAFKTAQRRVLNGNIKVQPSNKKE